MQLTDNLRIREERLGSSTTLIANSKSVDVGIDDDEGVDGTARTSWRGVDETQAGLGLETDSDLGAIGGCA